MLSGKIGSLGGHRRRNMRSPAATASASPSSMAAGSVLAVVLPRQPGDRLIICVMSGSERRRYVSHSVMIHSEWLSKGPISFPLKREPRRECCREGCRTVGMCPPPHQGGWTVPRLAEQGSARRGADGVRGIVDFCDPAKINDIPGLPTGDIPSRKRPADGTPMTSLPASDRPALKGC